MWPFSRKRSSAGPAKAEPELVFKSAQAFFEAQCMYGETELVRDRAVVAMVLDARDFSFSRTAVRLLDDGRQMAMIKVAADDGGFAVPAQTMASRKPLLQPGELVFWVPREHQAEIAAGLGDERCGWIGFIVATIAPQTPFKILEDYS